MTEFGDRSSEKYSESVEEIECPICKKGKIRVNFISGWMEWKVSRIAAKSARTKFFHDPKTMVLDKCLNCGASKKDIKEAIEHGKQVPHEERVKRSKKSGLPVMIESIVEERDDE